MNSLNNLTTGVLSTRISLHIHNVLHILCLTIFFIVSANIVDTMRMDAVIL